MQVDGDQVARVPPQEASARQVATALYRYGREAGWEQQWLNVRREIALAVIDLAREDGRLDRISFARRAEQRLLEESRCEPRAGPGRRPADQDGPGGAVRADEGSGAGDVGRD